MVGDIAAAIFMLVIIYILVRPSSQGTTFITAFTTLITALISTATAGANGGDTSTTGQDNG